MLTVTNIRDRLWGNAQYKFSIIFCSLYAVIFYGNQQNSKILWYIFISIILSIGVAGIGYSLNDWYDYKDDLKNNKQNIFLYFNKFQSFIIVLLFIFFSIFPWFILPFNHFFLFCCHAPHDSCHSTHGAPLRIVFRLIVSDGV